MRKFVLTGIVLGLLTSCGSSSNDQGESTSDSLNTEKELVEEIRIEGNTVTYEADSITMQGYVAYDAAIEGKRPGILVVHEWWGHNDYARERADMLAEMGYTAIAVDMFGDGKTADHPDDAGKFAGQVMSDLPGAKARFDAAMDILKSHESVDPNSIAAIGYCFGGGVVLHMARMGEDLKGVVSFHGSLGTQIPAQPGEVRAKVLVLHGAADPFVPNEQVDAFKNEMEAAGVDFSFVAYDSAVHAFTNPGADALGQKFSLPLAYDEAADKDSWNKMKEFFETIF